MIFKAILVFALLFLFMMLGTPMAVALGASTVITLLATTSLGITTIATACFSGLDSFPLLAVPFFILAGNLMKFGGLSTKILEFADALVGHIKGSLGMVSVVASMFFAALSGSSPATVSAIGSLTIPTMEKEGYDRAYATAINAAAGTIGVIIPPSIPFVIYGVVANTSISDMFKAGILPGVLIGVALMIVNYIAVSKNGYGLKNHASKKFSLGKLWRTLKETWLALMVPIIILGGIYAGIFTPTESAVVGIVYTLIIGAFAYRELTLATIYDAIRESVLVNGQTMFLVGFSMGFARFLTMSQIPASIAAKITALDNRILVLLMINLFLLVVGCFIDNISSMLILTPIFLPVVQSYGMTPVQFGIVMTVNLCIGFITPPYGANLFIASAISDVPIMRIAKKIMPMIFAMLIVLLMLTFIPAISTFAI
ncbi:TRAP transporter large permease [Oscillibacter sp. MSJ-2]|uniref:TRAP transporter large permease n=1 Tax=Dysosmobacter acutus TaxID=2841504 RepID=A0ABS6F5M2_9FIRM|nr:TRAP transporter large permease [Dysosmobacter acutus]MBU5625592.1 TRAP transporter large permease [Dysosmobacter acutus]